VCPQCGSAAAVHTIAEWAAMAQANMSYQWQAGAPGPGFPGAPGPQPGYGPMPQPGPGPQPGFPDPAQYQQSGFSGPSHYQQSGFPDPSHYQQSGFPDPSQYQQPGFPDPSQQHPPPSAADPARPQPTERPGYQAGPPPTQQPGYQAGPPPGYPMEPWQSQPPPRTRSWESGSDASTFEDAIADAVLGAATKAIGRVIGRKMRQAYNERVAPAMAARQEAVLRERVAIAQRHPDLRACVNDQVVFLAGGTRVLPLASAMRVRTVEQSDALVAQLRG
jgi:hypothetical protein